MTETMQVKSSTVGSTLKFNNLNTINMDLIVIFLAGIIFITAIAIVFSIKINKLKK